MGTLNLPTDNDARFPDSATDPSRKEHQQQHDKANGFLNRFEVDQVPTDGQVWGYDGASGTWKPVTISGDGTGPAPATSMASAPAGSLFRVVYAGGWPASRPSARTDIFFDLVGVPVGTSLPSWMLAGDSSTTRSLQDLQAADVALDARVDALEARPTGTGGVTDHGLLSGLGDDDHTQYLNTTRGDTRYYTKAAADTAIGNAVGTASTDDRNRANHSGSQLANTISNFTSAVQAVPGFGSGGGGATTPQEVAASAYGASGALGSIQPWNPSWTVTQTNAALDNNDAIFLAAVLANPTKTVVGPDFYVPTHIDWSGMSVMLRANLMHVIPDTANGLSTAGGKGRSAFRLTNAFGAAQTCTVGSVQLGPSQPTANVYTKSVAQFILPSSATTGKRQGDLARYRQGDVIEVDSEDLMPGSADTGLPSTGGQGVYRAELVPVHGLALAFTGLTYPAGVTTIERRRIRGGTSAATALVSSLNLDVNAGTTGEIILPSTSVDFIVGEPILLVNADNSTTQVAVAGQMSIVGFGRTEFTYATNPVIRKVDKTLRVKLDLDVVTSGDKEAFIGPVDRVATVEVSGCFRMEAKVRVTDVISRAFVFKSCFLGTVNVDAWGISNHALGSTNAYYEQGYGYGVESRGTNYGTRVTGGGGDLRHWFTTNPNSRTRESTADAHLDYGCGGMFLVIHDALVTSTYSAAFDTHELCLGLWFTDCRQKSSSSGGRLVTTGGGFNNRGFGTRYTNCESDGAIDAFTDGGAALTAGLRHEIVYENCRALNYQRTGFSFVPFGTVGGTDMWGTVLATWAKIKLLNCLASGDLSVASSDYTQIGFQFRDGIFETENLRSVRFNTLPWTVAGGRHVWTTPLVDYTEGTGNNPGRITAEASLFRVIGSYRMGLKSGSTLTPIASTAGATIVQHEGIAAWSDGDKATGSGGLSTRPATFLTLSGGSTATAVDTRTVTSSGGSSYTPPAPTHTGVPTVVLGPAAGTGATFRIEGDDSGGTLFITPGTTPATGVLATITWATPFTAPPHAALSWNAAMSTKSPYRSALETGRLQVSCSAISLTGTEVCQFSWVLASREIVT